MDGQERRAGDLIAQGECSPSCMLAFGDETSKCLCRCRGRYHGTLADATVVDVTPWWDRCMHGGWSIRLLKEFENRRRVGLFDDDETYRGWYGIERRGKSYALCADVNRSFARAMWPERESILFNRFAMGLLEAGRVDQITQLPAEWFSMSGIRSLTEAQTVMALLGECWHGNPCGVVRAIEVLEGRPDPTTLGFNPEVGYPDHLADTFGRLASR